jgi:hypothetical protein
VTLKHLGLVSKLGRVAVAADSLSNLFKTDTLPKRILSALHPALYGIGFGAKLLIDRECADTRWSMHRGMEPLRIGVERHAQHVASITNTHDSEIHVWSVGGHEVFWHRDSPDDVLWTKSPIEELARAVFGLALAEHGTDTRLALTAKGFTPDVERAPDEMTSEVAELAAKLRIELTRRGRTVLLHGPAGAGKTAAARQLAEELAGVTIAVTSEMFDGTNLDADPFDLLRMWRPDAVILDDVDRCITDDQTDGWLLAGITRLRSVVPLVIATANQKDVFSGAVLRAGRFDRILHMQAMDDGLVREGLAALPVEIQDAAIATHLLGSYVDELAFRYSCGDDPAETLAEMQARQAAAGDGLARTAGVRARRTLTTIG